MNCWCGDTERNGVNLHFELSTSNLVGRADRHGRFGTFRARTDLAAKFRPTSKTTSETAVLAARF